MNTRLDLNKMYLTQLTIINPISQGDIMRTFANKIAEKDYYEHQASEKEFLAWYAKQDRQTYETPSVTVDSVIFAYNPVTNRVNLLLIQRKAHPDLHH